MNMREDDVKEENRAKRKRIENCILSALGEVSAPNLHRQRHTAIKCAVIVSIQLLFHFIYDWNDDGNDYRKGEGRVIMTGERKTE